MFVPVTAAGCVPVDATGTPVTVDAPSGQTVVLVRSHPPLWAFLASDEQAADLGALVDASSFATADPSHRVIARAIALIRFRRTHLYHPTTGIRLDYPGDGIVGAQVHPATLNPSAPGAHHGAPDGPKKDSLLFPRVDPAVIGRIHLAGTDAILLARNARRTGFYSLIAGYVEPGESLEEALAREVWEETGRRVSKIRYWGSQPWASSGAIMTGFSAVTADEHAVGHTDGELAEIRWVTRAQVPSLPLARKGSIAHNMIMEWFNGD